MKKQIYKIVAVAFATAAIAGGIVLYQLQCVKAQTFSIQKIGIIDDCLNTLPTDNTVIYNSDQFKSKDSHGQELLKYLSLRGYTVKIYYYMAEDENGNISSNAIVNGLNWMLENGIKDVNISLSSQRESEELKNWISEHKEIQIFSSYNNQDNSSDYPSMYEDVIASGASSNIAYKETDRKYTTNRILLWNHGIHYFSGNSFLSLETLLREKVEK